jgi:hypothetical protein
MSVMELVYTKWYLNQQMHAKIMGKYFVYKSIINDINFWNKLKITVLSLLIKLIMMTSIRRQRDPTYTDKVENNRKKSVICPNARINSLNMVCGTFDTVVII